MKFLIYLASVLMTHLSYASSPSDPHIGSNSGDPKNSYWKNFCGEIRNFKINFKNCLLVVGRSLGKLLCPVGNEGFGFLSNILKSISRVR